MPTPVGGFSAGSTIFRSLIQESATHGLPRRDRRGGNDLRLSATPLCGRSRGDFAISHTGALCFKGAKDMAKKTKKTIVKTPKAKPSHKKAAKKATKSMKKTGK
jgi:hypothetical protein